MLAQQETCVASWPDDEARWRAVEARDAMADGAFVYAVRSTGVYCRPTCPSRRPQRDRVQFFDRPAMAERAGFRPCRRCAPNGQTELTTADALVGQALRLLDTDSERPPTLAELGNRLGVSPQHLQRTFKRVTGVSPREYAAGRRVERLKAELRAGRGVTDALYEAGYGASSRLYESADDRLGMTPGTYRRGGQGMRIGYSIVSCPLGLLLVAATERGVCAVSMGDDACALETALHQEYPAAAIARDDVRLAPWIGAVVRHLEGTLPDLNLPVDVQATAFRWRVWEALQAIPYGSTRSYSEVAAAIGQPAAVRAVAHACATNPVAVVIPCHRVVQTGGGLGGYRWGLGRKRTLLQTERGASNRPA